ncbi:MAG TPA: transcriptional regulator MntR [Nitrososphaerales archaeon]|nr:transcriptional regulator MntR [Nitrososphaerales archaeon]
MPSHEGAVENTPRSEDYLETVYHLIKDRGHATTSDISTALEVRPPTVSNMIGKLAAKGYLEYRPYHGMKLTPIGERVAKSVIRRHQVIAEFMSMIGVDDQTAFEDTEGIEHHVHSTTIRRLERLVQYLRAHPETLKTIVKYLESD